MTPRQLKAFVAVAHTLSFARACEVLHLSQPALSLAIRGLEQSLGGRVFSRTTRQVRLTPEGAALLPQAERLLADLDNVRERMQKQFALESGQLTVAAMPSFAANRLPSLLSAFSRRHPSIAISVRDVIHEQVIALVETGRVEIGFAFEPEASPSLRFDRLALDRFIAIVPRDSALAARASVSWKELLKQPFIALERPSSMRRLLDRSLSDVGLSLPVHLECNQLTTACQFVASGLGVSVVPTLCQAQAEDAGVKCLQLSGPVVRRAVGLLARKDHQLSATAQALADVAEATR